MSSMIEDSDTHNSFCRSIYISVGPFEDGADVGWRLPPHRVVFMAGNPPQVDHSYCFFHSGMLGW